MVGEAVVRVHFDTGRNRSPAPHRPLMVGQHADPIAKHLEDCSFGDKPDLGAVNVRFWFDRQPQLDIFMSHGIGDKGWRPLKRVKDFAYVCVSGPAWRAKYEKEGLDPARILDVGYPKLDPLFDGTIPRAPRGDRIRVLYAPTHNGNQGRSSYPRMVPHLALLPPSEFEVRASNHPRNHETNKGTLEEFAWADVVIPDTGSTLYEAMALDLPVVVPAWLVAKSVKHPVISFESKFYRAGMGYPITKASDIPELVTTAAEHGLGERERAFIEGIFPRDLRGRSGKLAADTFTDIGPRAVKLRAKRRPRR
jgi:hypothetical protein